MQSGEPCFSLKAKAIEKVRAWCLQRIMCRLLLTFCTLSDTSGEILYAAKEDNNTNVNPGAKHLISEDEAENTKVSGESMSSVTLKDILMFGKMKNYILKVDIEGFDCKV